MKQIFYVSPDLVSGLGIMVAVNNCVTVDANYEPA